MATKPQTPAAAPADFAEFPMAMYRKDKSKPNGYEVRRAEDADHQKRMAEQGWKASPNAFVST